VVTFLTFIIIIIWTLRFFYIYGDVALVVSGVLSAAALLVGDSVQLDQQRLPVGRHVLVQRRLRIRGLLQQAGQRDRPVVHVSRQQAVVPGHPRLPLYVINQSINQFSVLSAKRSHLTSQ